MKWSARLLAIFLLTHTLPVAVIWLTITSNLETNMVIWISAASLGLAFLFGLLLYRHITKPLNEIQQHINQAADGNLTIRSNESLPGIFGKAASSLNAISNKLQEFVNRTQAESDAIVAEANRLRLVLNFINKGVFALDRDKNIILFNNAAAQITGLNVDSVIGQHINDVLPFMQNKKLIISQWVDECQGMDMQRKNWQNVTVSSYTDQDLPLNVEALYLGTDPSGIRTLVTFNNRTEEQQIEDMKVDFVALAAHELRTPVTVIKGYLEILDNEIGSDLDPEYREFIRKLEVSASQLAGSINNILHVSHIEHGELNLQLEVSDWKEIINDIVEELNKKAATQGKSVVTDIQDDLPQVSVDRVSITEVLNNLIDNAIKYSDRGQEVKVRVTADRKAGILSTEVIDQGVGMPSNTIDKLFTKFYRSHRTRTSHRGTGLGLYMSKEIVEAHGGRVHVESKEGEGSTFGFDLPTVASQDGESDNSNITRGVHGWIKNHSLYRG